MAITCSLGSRNTVFRFWVRKRLSVYLTIKDLLNLANLLLDATFSLIHPAFGLESFVANEFACALLDVTLGFLGCALDFVVSTVFHVLVSWGLSVRGNLNAD